MRVDVSLIPARMKERALTKSTLLLAFARADTLETCARRVRNCSVFEILLAFFVIICKR